MLNIELNHSCLFFLFFSVGLLSQELPPIQNYSPVEYGAGNQNWSLSQSNDKNIYSANNGGLLEFNGVNWKLYPSPNGTPLKSVKVIGELVYTGCYMEFGYWQKDAYGSLKYYSISSKLETPLIEDEHFWNIAEFEDWVLFQSLDRIYIYNTNNQSFEILEARTTRAEILEVDNKVYFQKIGQGIFTIEYGKSVLVSDHQVLKNDVVVGAFSVNKNSLILTEKGEFYFLELKGLKRWNISADIELSSVNVYSSVRLNDGSFVLGTISNGIYHLDKDGSIINHINQEKGLNNNTVLSVFQDDEFNIWLGLDNGISVMNLKSPFNEYIDHVGKLGVVYTAVLFNGFKYLGTNQGLFYKKEGEEGSFKLIENTEGQVWLLKQIGDTLFCGHNSGTFTIYGNYAKKISNLPGTWDIQPVKSHENLLIQGNYKGLSILEKTNGQWYFRNKIEGFDSASRFFEFVNSQHILVNHDFKGIFDLKIDTGFGKVLEVAKKDSKGSGSSLMRYNDKIIYTTTNGVFEYIQEQHDFIKDSLLTKRFFKEDDKIIGILRTTDDSEMLWGFSNKNIICVSPGQFNEEPKDIRIPIPMFFRKSMGVLGFESITYLKDELYLIGISNGYVTLDLNKLESKKYKISISSVSIEFHDDTKREVRFKEDNEFKFAENNLSFFYNIPEYDKYTEVNYQFQLGGIYDDWSSWSTNPQVSFNNLPYGDYIFKVKARVGNTLTENIASYKFTIARPWYVSHLALFFYIIGAILISALIHRLYRSYYNKQQQRILKDNKKSIKRKKLKAEKKIVQVKNAQLQELVESKNRELAISTMSIIRKNEFLTAIKNELKESDQIPKVKSVIRTIDRNINNVDDWKLFEEAFNNADKDFLKKVKNLHPQLTANDLRLCAYLRLNLSSKEIAPLLNISSKSVEVKRYRLRKKMNLLHKDSLTDYILQL